MGFAKKELIEFMDGLVELASEENKAKAILVKEQFLSDFEKSYGYEKEVITEVSSLPSHYIAAMPDSVQEEIIKRNHLKGPKKRTKEDDMRFQKSFERLIRMKQDQIDVC